MLLPHPGLGRVVPRQTPRHALPDLTALRIAGQTLVKVDNLNIKVHHFPALSFEHCGL